jgi:hypothetical protein
MRYFIQGQGMRPANGGMSITPDEYAAHSTPMEYNFKGIPLGRQGRHRDWAKVGVLNLALK